MVEKRRVHAFLLGVNSPGPILGCFFPFLQVLYITMVFLAAITSRIDELGKTSRRMTFEG